MKTSADLENQQNLVPQKKKSQDSVPTGLFLGLIPVFPMETIPPVSGSSCPVGKNDPMRFQMVSIDQMGP